MYHISRYCTARRVKATTNVVVPLLRHLLSVLRSPAIEREHAALGFSSVPSPAGLRALAVDHGRLAAVVAPPAAAAPAPATAGGNHGLGRGGLMYVMSVVTVFPLVTNDFRFHHLT